MSETLRHSTIEFMRKRNHKRDRIKLYELNEDGDTLKLLYTLTKGFLISRNPDTTEGAAEYLLTVDMIYTPNLSAADFQLSSFLDVVDLTDARKQRFRLNTNTTPLIDDYRFVCGLHPAFNDAKVIV